MDLPAGLDVTTLRGRHAVQRGERTSVGDVLERLTGGGARPSEHAGLYGGS